ncbi:hypothetical protein V1512DRAFT_265132 [Lipomyces arxii]|uniref:uncharacterized protein n=1 Tax=Lipomyces arxii TaxID=56418 RepID=UPI0034CFC8CD
MIFSFNTPTKAEKLLRREITTKYGNIVLLSTIIILALLMLRIVISNYLPRVLRRPVPLWFTMTACTVGLVILSFLETHDDYLYLTKRFGRVATATLPGLLFLSLKPSPIPRESYLRLLPFHIWLGRILIAFATAHGILYVNYYFQISNLKKILQFDNFLGVILLSAFLLTFVVSFHFIRSRNHELFFRTHYLFTWVTVILVAIHARPRIYLIATILLILLGGQLCYRYGYGKIFRPRVNQISPTTQMVTLPRSLFPKYFPPGAHVRLSPVSGWSRFWWFAASHPYTIANLASDEEGVRLIVKPTLRFRISDEYEYMVNGPFASLGYDFFMNMYKNDHRRMTVVVTGGVGISFAVPIVTTLRKMNEQVKLLWAIRSLDDLLLLEIFNLTDVDVFFTKGESPDIDEEFTFDSGDVSDGESTTKGGVPLTYADASVGSSLITDQDMEFAGDKAFVQERNIRINKKRLNIESELKEYRKTVDNVDGGCGMWLICCGSRSLVGECSKWGRKLGATVHEELYDI